MPLPKTAVACAVQASQRAGSSLREGAAFLARYLLSYAALGPAMSGQGPSPATLLPLPSAASRQPSIQSPMFEGSLTLEGELHGVLESLHTFYWCFPDVTVPSAPFHRTADGYANLWASCIADVALVPLLCYLECQRWLDAHDPAGADVDVQQLTLALQHFIVDRCLCNSQGTRLKDAQAQLGFK